LIKTILFDVDGVLLSEEHYFDASALTVWEMLISDKYLGLSPEKFKTDYSEIEIKEIRELVFGSNDQVLKLLKSRGLNANWDMIYLSFCHQLIHLLSQIKDYEFERINRWLQAPINRSTLLEIGTVLGHYPVKMDFAIFIEEFERTEAVKQELFDYLNVLANQKLEVVTTIFQKGELWSVCELASQEWYVGDEHVLESTGRPSVQTRKKGFLANETTLAPREDIGELFKFLIDSGYQIGIGTGRPALETIKPFFHLDWLKYFDENLIVTADEVLKAEKEAPDHKSLSKPHPYTYLAGLYGKDKPVHDCLNLPLPLVDGREVLIVGDSLADLLAAREMGAQIAAVLTGLSGKDARKEFEAHKADYILDSVLNLKDILK
jgi:phosphoglycolate phosphatase-like HAD superfamily hydrolase